MLNLLAQKQLQLLFEDVENIFGNFTEKNPQWSDFFGVKIESQNCRAVF